MLRFCYLFVVLAVCKICYAQSNKIDSLLQLLKVDKPDSNRVTHLWRLAEQYQFFKPDTTLQLAQQAYLLAKNIQYTEGESRSLAIMATGQYLLGNYSAALNNYTLKLQLEEKRNSRRNYASALNNIGLMYILLADYTNALTYLHKADSIIQTAGGQAKKELANLILGNLGEAFYRIKQMDSANFYFNESLLTAINNQDDFYQGASLVGLANVKASEGKDSTAMLYYRRSLQFLNNGTNNDMLCETALGLANVFSKSKQPDSALYYAKLAFATGRKGGFLSRELDAAGFLSNFFKSTKKYDSAFFYMEQTVMLQDSLKGQAKTREAMVISSNEQLRQAEIAEQKQREKESRLQQLQVLAICIFIPLFFLITLAISRIRIHRGVVRFMGVVSLLLFFEFLVLLLHPLIGELTHHNKILELLILVVVGAGLVPLHHKLEKIVLAKLTKPLAPKIIPSVTDAENLDVTSLLPEKEIIEDVSTATATIDTEQHKNASATGAAEAENS